MAVISESSCSGPVAVALGLLSRGGSVFSPEPDRKRWTFGVAAGVYAFFQDDGVCLKSVSALDGLIVSGMKKMEGAKKCTECAENLRIILV